MGQQCIGISFWIFRCAGWGLPNPRTGRFHVQSNTPFGVAFRSLRSLEFLHIRAEKDWRVSRQSEPRRDGAFFLKPAAGRFRDFLRKSPTPHIRGNAGSRAARSVVFCRRNDQQEKRKKGLSRPTKKVPDRGGLQSRRRGFLSVMQARRPGRRYRVPSFPVSLFL